MKRSRIKQQKFFTDPTTGVVCTVTPQVSIWWILYIQDPQPDFINKEVHRVFFHKFVEFGANKKLFPKFVTMSSIIEEFRDCEPEYRSAGFPGCRGSTDATHIHLEKVSFGLSQAHLGYKMSVTTRTYNLTVNHRQKILHGTTGHPGRWNDKTLVRFDGFMQQPQDGKFNSTMSFGLSNEDGRDVTIKGAYVIVDNRYLTWSTTVPPLKNSMNQGEKRFSQWLKSLRKYVECTFGIRLRALIPRITLFLKSP